VTGRAEVNEAMSAREDDLSAIGCRSSSPISSRPVMWKLRAG